MSVTPDMLAVALGQAAPEPGSITDLQWEMWIDDAGMLIETRRAQLGVTEALDQAKVDYVVREAVVAHIKKPDDATQVVISIDDGSSSRTYQSGKGRVSILAEWWTLLGLTESNGGAYSFDMAPHWGASPAVVCGDAGRELLLLRCRHRGPPDLRGWRLVSLAADLAGILPELRAAAESRMDSTWSGTRSASGAPVLNEETGEYESTTEPSTRAVVASRSSRR
jgi:hypothetical protein